MAKYNLPNYAEKDGLGFPLNFRRGNPNPLDNSSVWATLVAAEEYAKNDPVAYVGQILSVVDNESGVVSIYSIQDEAGTLKPVGTVTLGDNVTVVKNDDDTLSIKGFADAVEGAQIRKNSNGEIEWFVPSTDTVDGLQSTVSGIQSDVKSLQENVTAIEEQIGTVTEGKTVVEMISDAQTAATYDDAPVIARIAAIEGDYLKSEDKAELTEAIATAKQETIQTVLGETVDADFDTLQEVAEWIQSDTTNSAQLIARVSAIESDYLKGADKTELQGKIADLEAFVGDLPEGAVSTTVIAYIQEVVDDLKIGDYAKAADLIDLAGRISAIEAKLTSIQEGAQVNIVDAVDEEQFSVEEKTLKLLDVAMSKVTGLSDVLAQKVDKVEGSRLITDSEAEKLEALVIDEDGKVAISGIVNANNVQGLPELLAGKVDVEEGKGLSTNDLTDELVEKINDGAQVNVIETIKINGIEQEVTDKVVDLPMATAEKLGFVKGSDAENQVAILEDGSLEVNTLNVNKLVQTDGETLILNGGSSAI